MGRWVEMGCRARTMWPPPVRMVAEMASLPMRTAGRVLKSAGLTDGAILRAWRDYGLRCCWDGESAVHKMMDHG